jgi:glucosyl-3-phosphoglycerate synthase
MISAERWLRENTFHHSPFSDIELLLKAKRDRGLRISLCFPTLNEEKTIGEEVSTIVAELKEKYPLLDEVAVVDSGSTDRTPEIARSAGASFFLASEHLREEGEQKGKGENLWKALYLLEGDIIIYLDADISNLHPKFVYGLLGPLLLQPEIKFTKAFYERPLHDYGGQDPRGGGRVTEILIRPLFSQFFPELSCVIQPLSGEFAGYRRVFEQLPYPVGYGVDMGLLIDIYQNWGLESIAQVDMDKRIHANQDTQSLGRMSFRIMQTFWRRLAQYKGVILQPESTVLQQVDIQGNPPQMNHYSIREYERRPIRETAAYRKKFGTQ